MPDVADVTIEIDASTATSRLNSDGNYYTISFPDDFIGTRGTADDPFKDVRIGTASQRVHQNSPHYMEDLLQNLMSS